MLRGAILYLLVRGFKWVVYPIYIISVLTRGKSNNWKVKFPSIKAKLKNLVYAYRDSRNTTRITFKDRLKEIIFNVGLSLPLRLLFWKLGWGPSSLGEGITKTTEEPEVRRKYLPRSSGGCQIWPHPVK
jgi:hypothetical protein